MRTRKWIQAALLLFLGLYLLDSLISGRMFLYISERSGWLTWIGAFILLAMGAVQVFELMTTKPTSDAVSAQLAYDKTHAGHAHGARDGAPSWVKLVVISIPLMIGLAVPARPLGAAAAQTSGVGTTFNGGATTSVLNVASTDRNVLDWIRAFNSTTDLKPFIGQKADVLGFVYRDIRFDEKTQFMVARFAISCCVSDANALGLTVQTTDAARFDQDSWVRVKGQFKVQQVDGKDTPVLVAETIEPAQQPKNPYLYP